MIEKGVLTVDIPKFRNCHSSMQLIDNTNHVILSTKAFRIPADEVARFSVEMRAEILGARTDDYRFGIDAFIVADTTSGTNMIFAIFSVGDRFFAEHEIVAVPGQDSPFTRIVEDPLLFERAGCRADCAFRHCSIEIDRSGGQVVWRINDHSFHVAAGLTGLPEEVHIGFGMFTLVPVGEGGGSYTVQGARASWRNFKYCLST